MQHVCELLDLLLGRLAGMALYRSLVAFGHDTTASNLRKPKGVRQLHRWIASFPFSLLTAVSLPLLAAAVIALLGIDAVVSAYRDTRSLLSRIGPLP